MIAHAAARIALVAALTAALLLAGCGGDDEEATTPTSQDTTSAAEARPNSKDSKKQSKGSAAEGKDSSNGEGSSGGSGGEATTSPPISSAPVEGTDGAAPGVKTAKGGDNSVQTYGAESSSEERTEAAIALQTYLNARAAADWERVCSLLAQRPRAETEHLANQAQAQGRAIGGCAGVLKAISPAGPNIARQLRASIEEVLSFRREEGSDLAFLLFVGPPGDTLYSVPMYLEGGEWKVGSLGPNPLPV